MNAKGIVIREMKLGDNDKLLTIFSEEHGRINAIARGARRQGNRLSAVRLLCYASFVLFKSPKGYSVNEFEIINSFSAVSCGIEQLSLASYFSEIIYAATREKLPDKRLLSLFLNSLYVLGKNELPIPFVKAVFELRCACLMGYEPCLSECIVCGGEAERFSGSNGGAVCKNCGANEPAVEKSTLSAMRYICSAPDKRLYSFRVSDEIMCELSPICEDYLLECVEFTPNSLEMYKNLVAN